MLFLLLGHGFPSGFGLSGVIIPKKPPCFAIPFFEPSWFPHGPQIHVPRTVFIQDVCNSQLATFAGVELDSHAKTIPAKYIKALAVASGEFDIATDDADESDSPIFLGSLEKLYAFAESFQSVQIGHSKPLRERLARQRRARNSLSSPTPRQNIESEGSPFTNLELARFQRDRQWCLDALRACFDSLDQHNRILAVQWLQMTKQMLRKEEILESTD